MRMVQMVSLLALLGCASIPRTKLTDKSMRVMIDPAHLDQENYVRLQTALVNSGKWVVVDRSDGFEAVKQEQLRQNRTEDDRYEDKERWSHWGKLYGVGAVIVPHADCIRQTHFWTNAERKGCRQFLRIVDANTAEVIAAVEGQNTSTPLDTPDWKDTVASLDEHYPEVFEKVEYHEKLKAYQVESEERAKKEKEKNFRDTSSVK